MGHPALRVVDNVVPGAKKNPLRRDPTRTTLLRRRLLGELYKRFRSLRGDIHRLVVDDDAFGIRADRAVERQAGRRAAKTATSRTFGLASVLAAQAAAPVTNAGRWRFETDAAKVEGFHSWLKERIDAGILEVSPANANKPWVAPYISSAYKQGTLRAYTDVHAADIVAAKELSFVEGGKKAFLDMSFNAPVGQNKLALLHTRAFSQLRGVTTEMDKEMSRILADGLVHGKGAEDIARALNDSVSTLERTRARTIARTEIIYAHSEGQLDAFEAMNIEEVSVMAEWSTAADSAVCEMCAPLEGVILTIAEARGMIPRHPNCVTGDMCVVAPGALAMLKTKYTGEIIDLVTVGGRRISVTPAHVLLTKYGFARAESVYNGLDLVVDTGMYGGVQAPDYEHRVPCIADEFIAAAETLGMPSVSVPTAPEHLHHEGGSCYKEINIVFADGVLGGGSNTKSREALLHGTLPFCEGGIGSFALRTFAEVLLRAAHTSDGSMGRVRDALAFLLGRVLEAHQVRFGATTGPEPCVGKAFPNDASVDFELLRNCLDRHPVLKQLHNYPGIDLCAVLTGGVPDLAARLVEAGFDGVPSDPVVFGDTVDGLSLDGVQCDKIIGVKRRHVDFLPVYDVQTTSTLYSVGGLIASNCRCCWIPADVGEKKRGTTKTIWAGKEPGAVGKTTGQVRSADEVAARLRDSIKAERPKLSTARVRAAS